MVSTFFLSSAAHNYQNGNKIVALWSKNCATEVGDGKKFALEQAQETTELQKGWVNGKRLMSWYWVSAVENYQLRPSEYHCHYVLCSAKRAPPGSFIPQQIFPSVGKNNTSPVRLFFFFFFSLNDEVWAKGKSSVFISWLKLIQAWNHFIAQSNRFLCILSWSKDEPSSQCLK